MQIDSWSRTMFRLTCDCGESFLVRTLGPSVECPICGNSAVSSDLTTDYYTRRDEAASN